MGKVEKVYTRKTGKLVGIVKRFCYDGRGYATVVTASGHIQDTKVECRYITREIDRETEVVCRGVYEILDDIKRINQDIDKQLATLEELAI